MKLEYTLKQDDMIAMTQDYGKTQPKIRKLFRIYKLSVPVLLGGYLLYQFIRRVTETGFTTQALLALAAVIIGTTAATAAWLLLVRIIRKHMMKTSAKASYGEAYEAKKTLELLPEEILITTDTNGETKEIRVGYNDITAITSDATHYFIYFGEGAVTILPFIAFNPAEDKDRFMLELEQKRKQAAGNA